VAAGVSQDPGVLKRSRMNGFNVAANTMSCAFSGPARGHSKMLRRALRWTLHSSGNEILTLVTCYPFYFVGFAPDRFIVRAERVT
jgi:hypothetical protein